MGKIASIDMTFFEESVQFFGFDAGFSVAPSASTI
jgi:hypothetical protein